MTEAGLVWEPLDLEAAVRLMRGFPARWWVAGGRALDLFTGKALREHDDVDILVPHSEQEAIRAHLPGWDFQVAAGGTLRPWAPGEHVELPRSDLWARSDSGRGWQLQFMLGECEGGTWRYRRNPSISLPVGELGLTSADGIPYVRPEVVLLFKSKEPRPRDEADFEAVLAALDEDARRTLAAWLPPGNRWRGRL